MPDLATIGYQSATLPEVIARLKGAGIEVLIDVRAVASSRRAGFSKTLLANGLAETGIDYVHLRGLGTPKPGRDAARHGDIAKMHVMPMCSIACARISPGWSWAITASTTASPRRITASGWCWPTSIVRPRTRRRPISRCASATRTGARGALLR